MTESFFATIVIPAFNEGTRLPGLLEALAGVALGEPGRPVRFVVCDDGSTESHAAAYEAALRPIRAQVEGKVPHRFELIRAPQNQGKGSAIRRGWAEKGAGSTWLGFLDADGAIGAQECFRLIRVLEERPIDVLAGSRVRMAGRHIERSPFRHMQGRVFATLAEAVFDLGFYDTQCGVKFFRGDLLTPHLPRLAEERWMLDIELLALMKRLGARMAEEPIDWFDQAGSKVRFGIDAWRMFVGLRRIKRRLDASEPVPAAPRAIGSHDAEQSEPPAAKAG